MASLGLIVETISQSPTTTFPRAFNHPSYVEAFDRLVNNDSVNPDALAPPHQEQAWKGVAAREASVLVLHDTSDLTFEVEFVQE